MSSKSRKETLALSFLSPSFHSLSPSFSLPPPSLSVFLSVSLSHQSREVTRVVPPGLVPGVLLYMATSTQASQPAGGGATFGDTRLDTGLNRLQQQVSPLSGCPVLSFAVSVLVTRTKPLRSRRRMGGRLSQNLNNGWALGRNRVSGGGCLPCTCTWAPTLGPNQGGGCLLDSGHLPGIVPTHVYECMFVVYNYVYHFSSSLSSGAEQYIVFDGRA